MFSGNSVCVCFGHSIWYMAHAPLTRAFTARVSPSLSSSTPSPTPFTDQLFTPLLSFSTRARVPDITYPITSYSVLYINERQPTHKHTRTLGQCSEPAPNTVTQSDDLTTHTYEHHWRTHARTHYKASTIDFSLPNLKDSHPHLAARASLCQPNRCVWVCAVCLRMCVVYCTEILEPTLLLTSTTHGSAISDY